MFAEVAILRNAKAIDMLYTYRVEERFFSEAMPGRRVLVSFGQSAQVEGVIIKIKEKLEEESSFSIKSLNHVFGEEISLSLKDIEIVDFIRENYLCGYSEAIQLFLPSGIMTIPLKKYRVTKKGLVEEENLSKRERILFSQIKAFDVLEHSDIEADFSEALKDKALKKLISEGYLTLEMDYEDKVKDRYSIYVRKTGDIEEYKSGLNPRYKAKHRLCEVLSSRDFIPMAELKREYNIPKSVVDSFVELKLIELEKREEKRIPYFMEGIDDKSNIKLNEEQNLCYKSIIEIYESGHNFDFLLYGITGSGKTEIYAELIEYTLSLGKKSILMVPEISLTPQIVSRFASRFGKERIAILHSKISDGEKHDQWKGIRNGEFDIIIGARSAVFAPTDEVGLIIMDEEHEASYRSEKRPKYDAYEIAREKMILNKGMLICGSATPSLESFYEAQNGKRHLIKLKKRHNKMQLPDLEIVDMRVELKDGNFSILSRRLFSAIETRLERGEQSIIFLNRKGHSTFVSCRSCGFSMNCPNCDVTLTFYKGEKAVRCNYCGYNSFIPKKCPSCSSSYFKYFGTGTEKVEETLKEYFKDAVIARMDRTTTAKKGSLETIIKDVEREKVDILIGTQMVTKGFDFKNVTLVGILSADLMLNFPSYQASERAFQLIQQVAGRTSRGDKAGEVILQTYIPEHYAVNVSDYEEFYNMEINYRKIQKYPPFYKLINILILSKDEESAIYYAKKAHVFLAKNFLKKDLQKKLELYEPSPALLKKIDGCFRWQIILKAPPDMLIILRRYFKMLEEAFENVENCSIQIDMNAHNIL